MDGYASSPLARYSLQLITTLQTGEGAYPASPTFSAYGGYCWFRDGSFIADAASAAGRPDSAETFFSWCAHILEARADQIEWIVSETGAGRIPDQSRMLPTRYRLDGTSQDDGWWNFQLDGYGTWLWALAQHSRRYRADPGRWQRGIDLTVDYLCSSWARPCYDWWEEHPHHVHVSTLACVAAGLRAVEAEGLVSGVRARRAHAAASVIASTVADKGTYQGSLAKWLGSTAVDGSLAATLAPLGFLDPSSRIGRSTVDLLERHLTVDNGTHRYLGDTFYGGGQWPLLSCFLAMAHLASGSRRRATELYDWAASTATAKLDMPEQVGRHLIAPGMRQEWLDRWGPVATPLLWSHAMLLRLAVQLDQAATPAHTHPIDAEGAHP